MSGFTGHFGELLVFIFTPLLLETAQLQRS